MILFEEALEIILSDVYRMGVERVGFEDSLHRILAEEIHSDVDMPPFNKAAMDGYACRREDLDMELKVLEVIAAGDIPTHPIARGECSKIMTGAMVPHGADTVIMVEESQESKAGHIRFTGKKTRSNIALKAEDVKQGQMVWEKGMQILPQHIAIMASVGAVEPLVAIRPRVAILSTGDELVEPGERPGPGKIRNSNGFQLMAQVRAAGAIPNYMGIVPDSEEATRKAITTALDENQVVILTGGVSAGDYDFVPKIMRQCGVDIRFQKVAVKPGRPTVFGRMGNAAIFGLPGNPVSSFINFETFVRPLTCAMMGSEYKALELRLPMGVDWKRKKADRLEFLPVGINNKGEVVPVSYHGSAHIHAICLANALMSIPRGVFEIRKGEYTDVRPF